MSEDRAPDRRILAGARPGWFFEDAEPGAVIRHRGGRTVGEGEHVWLAWVTDNASDLHGNADRASRGPFGQPVVLGALTVAVVAGLASPGEGEPEDQGTARPTGWIRILLSRAVMPGDTLRAESRIHTVEAGAAGTGGTVHRTIVGFNQRGEEVVNIEERRWVPSRPGGTKDC